MGLKVSLILLGIMMIGCSHIESKNFEHIDMKVAAKSGQICQLCENITTKAIFFLTENDTQAEIVDSLHHACSHLASFEPQCISMADYYTRIFFLEVAKFHPKVFCEKVKLCHDLPVVHIVAHDDPCTLCHNAINELLSKLEDPDMQFEVIQTLLKICNKAENFARQCKKLVLEYGPIILANTEKYLKKTDICTAIHVCKAGKETDESLFASS